MSNPVTTDRRATVTRAGDASRWRKRREAGTLLSLRLTVWIARTLGRRVVRAVMVPVAGYFFLVRGVERRASRQFLSRVAGKPASLWQVYRHFLTFALVAVDRIYFLCGETHRIGSINSHNVETAHELMRSGCGGVFLATHLGSFEAARVMGSQLGYAPMRVVLDRSVNARFIESLEALNSELAEMIIDASQPAASLGLKVAEAIDRGEWVGFLADRYMGEERTVACEFLGSPARFALGPFLVAAAFKAPVFCVFPLLINGRYEVYMEEISRSLTAPRGSREEVLHEAVQRYVTLLEHYVRFAPYNWFNFYDFWADQ